MKTHPYVILVTSIVIAINAHGNARYALQDPTIFNRDTTYLDSFVLEQMNMQHIPGLAACVTKDGEIIWTGAYGYANFAQTIQVEDTTLFMLASISKTFTGTAVMQLWEQDLLDLDDDINDYLPFTIAHPQYPDSAITVRMLLTHTSGIVDDWAIIAQSFCWGGDSPISLDTFLYNYLTPGGYYYSPTNYGGSAPGNAYSYCNVSTALAGYLVQVVSDSFPLYCHDSIFTPLEMNQTSWFLADLDTSNIAIPYQYIAGQYIPYGLWGHPMYPAFQMRTSTLQLVRYLIAFMQYGMIDTTRILDSTTVELMTTVQDPSVAPNQGLLWIRRTLNSRLLWGHSGSTLGVRTEMWFCREDNSGAIILTNGESDSLHIILHELFEFAAQHGTSENNIEPVKIMSLQVMPNPFHLTTEIRYSIEELRNSNFEMRKPSMKIYDASGRVVKSFDLESCIQNQESAISWDGTDQSDRQLPAGVYFVRLSAGDEIESQKILLIK